MTIAKDFAAKASVAFVAAAMVLSMFAPAAQAQSSEDLQKMINDLLAQIASLQSQVGQGGSAAAGVCPYTWTRDLNVGATGADVKMLQMFLNANADTRVAASGVGSAGMETEYYGPATAAAVSKMQVMYRAEILTPAGLVNPTGYFGPSTRAKANALCVAAPTTPTTPTTPGDEEEEEEEDDNGPATLGGEASLDSFEMDTEESSVEEGESDVVVGMITVEFEDGDAEISRIDVALEGDTSDQPWDAFETVSLWVDGDMVAEFDASDEDNYLDEDTGEIRFSGLDIVAMEGEEVEIAVAVSVQNNLDTEELTDWTITPESIRFFDADGVASTETTGLDGEASFEVEPAGSGEEVKISLASSNPDATDIVVDTDTDTNDVTIMAADIEAEDNDIELNRVIVRLDIAGGYSTTTVATVVDEVRVEIDGQSFKAEAIGSEDDYNATADDDTPTGATGISEGYSELANAAGTSTWYLFDIDGDVVIDEDSEVAMEVIVDLNDTDDAARYPNGVTISASVQTGERGLWQAEGAEDLDSTQFKGTAVGDEHTLVAEGILVPVDGFSSEVDTLGQNDTIGEFTLEFEVTAIEGDFYITDNATSGSATDGVTFTVDGVVGTGSVSASLTSSADEDSSGVFTVREGETETFTLVVTVDPQNTGTFKVALDGIWYSEDTNGENGEEYVITTPSDFDTAPQSIQGS